MCSSTLQDVALVAGKSGQIAAYSVHDARRLAQVEHPARVFSTHNTPEGLATRTHSECRWWVCSARGSGEGQNVRINEVRRESLPAFEQDVAEQLSRHQVFGWLKDSWSLGKIHDLTTGAMRWEGMVSRPRELQVFLGHELSAPSIQSQYYSMCSVDYDNDRYLLYQNSLEGVLELAADAGNERRITAAFLLQQLPYARRAILSTLVPASNRYLEVSQFRLALWDLETQTSVCERPAERVDDATVDLDAGLLTTVEGSFLRQYDTHTLRSICETPLTPFAVNPRVLASAPRGPIVVVDEDNNLHFLHPSRQKTWNRVGLDSPPIGCVLSADGRSALITERRGRVSGFRL
ncbi:MAG: hypothetical protein JWL65_4001 [Gammaproteobacteria bacterium]|nr:hypothetical protein [Gammaproteobacteria bacterium]